MKPPLLYPVQKNKSGIKPKGAYPTSTILIDCKSSDKQRYYMRWTQTKSMVFTGKFKALQMHRSDSEFFWCAHILQIKQKLNKRPERTASGSDHKQQNHIGKHTCSADGFPSNINIEIKISLQIMRPLLIPLVCDYILAGELRRYIAAIEVFFQPPDAVAVPVADPIRIVDRERDDRFFSFCRSHNA